MPPVSATGGRSSSAVLCPEGASMDKQTYESVVRDFLVQYPLHVVVDWVRHTLWGEAFATAVLGAVMSGIGRIAAQVSQWKSATKQALTVAMVTCGSIAVIVAGWTLLAQHTIPIVFWIGTL